MSFKALVSSLSKLLDTTPAATSTDADTFETKTPAQMVSSIGKAQVGLGSLMNGRKANTSENEAGTATTVFSSPKGMSESFNKATDHLRGEIGDAFFLNGFGFSNLVPGKFLQPLSIVTTDAELNTMLSTEESMKDVFNNWKKISRGSWKATQAEKEALGYSDTAIQSDIDGFTYDEASGKIKNTADTLSLVGFISPTGYDNYVLDVILRSDSTWQNDPLGLFLGYVMDADGTTHTLTVMRAPWPGYYVGGALAVMVDYNTFAPITIKTSGAGLKWVDGTPATGPMNAPPPQPYAVKPWGSAPNGCRLRVTRAGDTFTIETTDYDATALLPAATISFTLNDHPSLARFKGPGRYGYAAISQDLAVWDVQSRPGARQAIVDIRDKKVRTWDGTQWVVGQQTFADVIKPNRFYYNRTTKKTFFAENASSLIHVL